MKKQLLITLLTLSAFLFQNATKNTQYSSTPPIGYTGAEGEYCNSCHGSFNVNSGGGGITIEGLPNNGYEIGKKYPFSLTISHHVADRNRWGFSVAAVDNNGNTVGSFSSTNTNATSNGKELSHANAVFTNNSASYTYNNLVWNAPATSGKDVTFYYVGNAANGNGSTDNDYIYAGSSTLALPIHLATFTAKSLNETVQLNWETLSEINCHHFEIEKSEDGQLFYRIAEVKAAGATTIGKKYQFTDAHLAYYNRYVYYRIKQVDIDNQWSYSPTQKIFVSNETTLAVRKVFPTIVPKGGTVYAEILNEQNLHHMTLQLVDITGKLLKQQIFALQKGNNLLQFKVPLAVTGSLFLRFSTNKQQQTMHLQIK